MHHDPLVWNDPEVKNVTVVKFKLCHKRMSACICVHNYYLHVSTLLFSEIRPNEI